VSLQPENADGAQLIELTGLQIENEAEFGLKVSNLGESPRWTLGDVKQLLPPRQNRGVSHLR
jgi:hypothetical protein